MLKVMKTKYLEIDWLVPLVGIAVVAGSIVAARTYFDLERKTQADEALAQTVGRLYQDQKVNAALKSIHEGDTKGAAQRLDALLCEDILRLNRELASADARTRAFVEDALRRMALARPGIAAGAASESGQERSEDQLAAELILRKALGNTQTAQVR